MVLTAVKCAPGRGEGRDLALGVVLGIIENPQFAAPPDARRDRPRPMTRGAPQTQRPPPPRDGTAPTEDFEWPSKLAFGRADLAMTIENALVAG
jgi:hypothetical protein